MSKRKNASAPEQNGTKPVKEKKRLPPWADLLIALALFIGCFFLAKLTLPHLYAWGLDYGAVKGLVVPLWIALTLFMGYRAQAKLYACLVMLFRRIRDGKK